MAPAGAPALLAAVAALVAVAPAPRAAARVSMMVSARRRTHPTSQSRSGLRRRAVMVSAHGQAVIGFAGRLVRNLARCPPDEVADRRLGVVVVVATLAGLVAPVLIVPVALVAFLGPGLRRRSAQRRRRDQIAAEIPDLVELFRLAVTAGLTVHQAAAAVASRAPGITGAAVAAVPRRVAGGERLADALDRLVDIDEEIRPLAGALASAERYGLPLGPTLERLALEARLARRRRAEEVARRLPVQMLFPLVLCILPAFGLLSVVPLVLAALGNLPH
jgi:tight adherence protein C